MDFEWDEQKRQSNLRKHDIDFIDVQAVFDGRPLVSSVSRQPAELRFLTTAEIEGIFYTVVWTWRGDIIRIISARRARDEEKRDYRSLHGGGT